ncbi:hypothetical protein IQ247_31935, partial [Plectonema cf. radiosum LEGE 06105]|nr:hypothetical protein [Plectonema cf. radiosum LEGE 06105]
MEVEEMYSGTLVITAKDTTEWRNWLNKNSKRRDAVWLVIYKKGSNKKSIYYDQAVDDALCYGWIDSKPNKRDEESYYQYFSKRNPKSNWSKVNKDKVSKLLKSGLMMPSGLEMVELAKSTGT